MENTYAARLESVKFYVLNTYDFYAVIADNVRDARENRKDFATLIGCVMVLLSEEWNGFRHFPAEFHGDYSIVLDAVTEIVEEWEL